VCYCWQSSQTLLASLPGAPWCINSEAASCTLTMQADSGADEHLTTQLSVAPTVLLDARLQGSTEHASFAEAEEAGENGAVPMHLGAAPCQHGFGVASYC
jgi:hypothetical protein